MNPPSLEGLGVVLAEVGWALGVPLSEDVKYFVHSIIVSRPLLEDIPYITLVSFWTEFWALIFLP